MIMEKFDLEAEDESIDNPFNGKDKNPEEKAEIQPIRWLDMSKWDSEPAPERQWAIRDRVPLRSCRLRDHFDRGSGRYRPAVVLADEQVGLAVSVEVANERGGVPAPFHIKGLAAGKDVDRRGEVRRQPRRSRRSGGRGEQDEAKWEHGSLLFGVSVSDQSS